MSDLADWRCRHCDATIAFGTSRCPECGARQGFTEGDEKVIIAIAGVGAIFFVIGVFGLVTLPYAIWSDAHDPNPWVGVVFAFFVLFPGMAYAALYLYRNWAPGRF